MNLYHDIDDELLLPVTSAMQLQPIDNIREDDDMLTAAVVVKSSTLFPLPLFQRVLGFVGLEGEREQRGCVDWVTT